MKKIKILSVLILSLALLSLCAMSAAADPYSYTVRVFAGNQGADKGALVWEQTYAAYAECFLPRELAQGILGPGSKYYVKGFKESGYGGEYACHAENFIVDRDHDFVIAYGMPDRQVSYTISFLEWGTGNVLAEPVIYYGNLGDKPVVAYQYIDGYRPLYRNITATLKESGNAWTFEYVKQEEPKAQETDAQGSGDQSTRAAAAAGTPAANVGTRAVNASASPDTSDTARILADGVQEPVNSPQQTQAEEALYSAQETTQAEEPQSDPAAGVVNTSTGEVIRETAADEARTNAAASVVIEKPETSMAAAPKTIDVLDLDAQEEETPAEQADGGTAETAVDTHTAQTDTGTLESANGESDLRGETTHGKALSTEAIIGIIAGCVAALALILWLISRNRRKE